jgi:PAS domain S-box-containing protein
VRAAQPWTTDQRASLLEHVPSGVAVIDRDFKIVDMNRAYEELFGDGRGKHCYSMAKGLSSPCPACPAAAVFEDGVDRVVEQTVSDRHGNELHYLAQLTPARRDGATVDFVATILSDLTATRRLQREYQTLFEKVPCYVVVLNRGYRVVRANEKFRKTFGEPMGEHCYRLFKDRAEPCGDCPMEKTFADGGSHSSRHEGVARDGTPTHYAVCTAPLLQSDGSISHVIEMALDLTQTHQLEQELTRAHVLRSILIESTLDAIVVVDTQGRIVLMNRAADTLWGYARGDLVGQQPPAGMIPLALQPLFAGKQERLLVHEAIATTSSGARVPVRLAGVCLVAHGKREGTAVIAQDLREIKQLERDKLDAERLAAVGQTVAGLAHGIKNILSGVEGGMYVTSSGIRRGDQDRVHEGWEMLERNIGRISELAKSLLAFARGDSCKPKLIRPAAIVAEAAALYTDSAEQHGVELVTELADDVAEAWMDPEGLHSCLANLISNAIDACLVSSNPTNRVIVRLFEENDTIVLEVNDTGCGMDYEVKQKAFTSFFSTKGAGGTGLGLLLTRKIVQQHGGSITATSTQDAGSTFRVSFPRGRLPRPTEEEDDV